MADQDQTAKDIVVAWLSHNGLVVGTDTPPSKVGAQIAEIYTLVLQAVQEGIENRSPAPVGAQIIIEKRPE